MGGHRARAIAIARVGFMPRRAPPGRRGSSRLNAGTTPKAHTLKRSRHGARAHYQTLPATPISPYTAHPSPAPPPRAGTLRRAAHYGHPVLTYS